MRKLQHHAKIIKELTANNAFDHVISLVEFRSQFIREEPVCSSYVCFLEKHVVAYNGSPSFQELLNDDKTTNNDQNPRLYFDFLKYYLSTCSEENILVSKSQDFESPLVTYFRSSLWHKLFVELGPGVFRFLLSKTLLLRHSRQAYVQISGIAVNVYLNNRAKTNCQPIAPNQTEALLHRTISKSQVYYGRPRYQLKTILCSQIDLPDTRLLANQMLAEVFSDNITSDNAKFLSGLKYSRKSALLRICWWMVDRASKLNLRLELARCLGQDLITSKMPIPFHRVIGFCERIVFKIVPKYFMGSKENWRLLCQVLRKYIRLRKREGMTLNYIFERVKLNQIAWLRPGWDPAINSGVSPGSSSVSDFQKRQQIFARVLLWFFSYLVPNIIRSSFYVTESSSDPNGCFYYLHDSWKTAQITAINKYKEGLRPVPASELNESTSSSFVRVVPKKSENLENCRIIMRLGTPLEPDKPWTSVNWTLRPIFNALRTSMKAYHVYGRAHVHSVPHMLDRLARFRKQHNSRPVYYVKLDAEKCFDLLDRNIALELAAKLLQDENYWHYNYRQYDFRVARLAQDRNSLSSYRGTWCDLVRGTSMPHFRPENLPLSHKNGIQILQRLQILRKREELFALLRSHLHNCHINLSPQTRKEGDLYTIIRGIPQGSSMSTMLCNIVLDTMEKHCLRYDSRRSLLMRYVDDFLFLTTDRNEVDSFLKQMTHGCAEYGVRVNMAKTQSNAMADQSNQTVVEFLGVPIFAPKLEVSFSASNPQVTNTSTLVQGQKKAVANIRKRLLFQVELKLHAKSLDRLYESYAKLKRFIYHVCRDLALRLLTLVKLAFGTIAMDFLLWHVYNCVRGRICRLSKNRQARKAATTACADGFHDVFTEKGLNSIAAVVHTHNYRGKIK